MAEESRFAKIARVRVTQSAANNLTFTEFQTGVGLQVAATRGKGTGWLIDQLDYYVPNQVAAMPATGDIVRYGITTSNAIVDLESMEDQRILHAAEKLLILTTSGAALLTQPHSFQFFPALLWAEPTLFIASDGESLAVAAEVICRIFYRTIELDQQLVFEVAQAFRIIS